MKKYFWMALVALVPFAVTSCSDSDSDSGGSKQTTLAKLDTSKAKKFNNVTAKSEIAPEDQRKVPTEGEFKPDKEAIFHFEGGVPDEVKSRAGGEIWQEEWWIGAYQLLATGEYHIPNFATISITDGVGTQTVSIKFEGSDTPIEFEANIANYDVNTDDVSGWLAREWVITKTDLNVTGAVKNPIGAIYKGNQAKDIAYIANDLVTKHDIDIDADQLKDLKSIEKITFTVAGTIQVVYGNKQYAIGDWKWTKVGESFSYELRDEDMGNDLIMASGKGDVKFDGNTCELTIAGSVEHNAKVYNFKTTFTLQALLAK